MPRPGPRPYECVRRAWHSETHQPLRGALIQEIFRIVNEIHNPITRKKREWQEKLPIVVLRAEEILYSKANSESEYADLKSLRSRLDDAVNTMIRREETEEDGVYIAPCIEAALSLGCTPRKVPRGQRAMGASHFLSNSSKRLGPISANNGSYRSVCENLETRHDVEGHPSNIHDKRCQGSMMPIIRSWPSLPEQGNNTLTTSASVHSAINGSLSFSASQHNVGLSNHCIPSRALNPLPSALMEVSHLARSTLPEPGGHVRLVQQSPRFEAPHASSSHLVFNVHSDPRSIHNKCISPRIDHSQIQSLPLASDSQALGVSRLLKEASYTDRITPSFSNLTSGCVNSRTDFPMHGDHYYRQDSRFNPNQATFLTRQNSSQHTLVGNQVGLSHPSSNYRESSHPPQIFREAAFMLRPNHHTYPSQVSHPSLSSHETSMTMPMPSSHASPLQVPYPSSSAHETTTMTVPSNHTSAINVISPPQKTHAFDLQLRLGPPREQQSTMLIEPSVPNNLNCSESVFSTARNDPMMMAPDDMLRSVKSSSASNIDMHPSKRMKVGKQSFSTVPSMRYNGPHSLQQCSQPRV